MRRIGVGMQVAVLCAALAAGDAAAAPAADLAALRAATEAAPADGPAWYAYARGLQQAGRHRQALVAFDRSIELGHWRAAALLRGAQSAAALGDTNAALARIERVARDEPKTIALLGQVGGVPELAGMPRYEAAVAAAEKASYPCRGEGRHRDFDFWLGHWQVSGPQGQVVGENRIEADLEGCVVRESWTDAAGRRGTSVNFYDPHTQRWHQVWTSDGGTVTHYVGAFEDGAMRFHAEGFGDVDGVGRQRRMSFTPQPDGSVRQLIEESADGAHWTVGFDGRYRRLPQ